jgi:LacI family transcriptional regulator
MQRSSITQTELARLAGVSRKTVYRALHGKERIDAATVRRIRQLARKFNYRPNSAARSMVTGRYHNIAILSQGWVPYGTDVEPTDPVARITSGSTQDYLIGINDALVERGYCLSVSYMSPDVEEQKASVVFDHLRFDGLITLVELGGAMQKVVDELGLPIVAVNTTERNPQNCVFMDDVLGGEMLTDYLIERGHRNIAFLNAAPVSKRYLYGVERPQGYFNAMARAGLSPHPSASYYDFSWNRKPYWRKLLTDPDESNRPTAYITNNPGLTVSFIRQCRELYMVPGHDFSLVAFHDFPGLALVDPPITSLQLPEYEMGRTAGEMVLRMVEEPGASCASRTFPPRLSERASVKTLKSPGSEI